MPSITQAELDMMKKIVGEFDTEKEARKTAEKENKELKERIEALENRNFQPSTTTLASATETDSVGKLAGLKREADNDSHPLSFFHLLAVVHGYRGYARNVNANVVAHLKAYLDRQPREYQDLCAALAEETAELLKEKKPVSGNLLAATDGCKTLITKYMTTVLLNLRVQCVGYEYDSMPGHEGKRFDREVVMDFFIRRGAGQNPQEPSGTALSRNAVPGDACVHCHRLGHGNKPCHSKQAKEAPNAGKKKKPSKGENKAATPKAD